VHLGLRNQFSACADKEATLQKVKDFTYFEKESAEE
jgi:hypothetical protein